MVMLMLFEYTDWAWLGWKEGRGGQLEHLVLPRSSCHLHLISSIQSKIQRQ